MAIERWLEPYVYTKHEPIDGPPYWRNVQAVSWEQAALGEHAEVERLREENRVLRNAEADLLAACRAYQDRLAEVARLAGKQP